MKIGTKSVLFGAHCWFIHPAFVALAWWKLFGFPGDWRLWTAFFVHDLGYWGKPNMDGPEGERHVELGANLMRRYVDDRGFKYFDGQGYVSLVSAETGNLTWHDFCLYHSRFYSKRDGKPFSKLCVADKLAVALEPWWLYLPRVILSGEIKEYMAHAGGEAGSKYNGEPIVSKYLSMGIQARTKRQWHSDMTEYLVKWVDAHKDGREDTWTPAPLEVAS